MLRIARWLLAATALADYLRSHIFRTIFGDITFGPNGGSANRVCWRCSSRTSPAMMRNSSRIRRRR